MVYRQSGGCGGKLQEHSLFFRRNAAADGKEHPAYYQGEGAFD